MGNKSFLVAQREYMENLRTKTFWIGIFFFPVIVIAAILVPMWMERQKDSRKYAVIDQSGWLMPAVEARAALPDIEKVLYTAIERKVREEESFAELPEDLRKIAEAVVPFLGQSAEDDTPKAIMAVLDGEIGQKMLAESAEVFGKLGDPESDVFELASFPGGDLVLKKLFEVRDSLHDWWTALPPEEAKQYGSQLDKSRYVRVNLPAEGDDMLAELNRMVTDEEIFAYFVLGPDPLKGSEGFKYVSNNLTDEKLREWLEQYATAEVRERRLAEEDIDKEVADHIQAPVRFEKKKLSKTGEEEDVSMEDTIRKWAPAALVYMLWMAVFSISQMLLTNTIEEKSNRILEVLLSSVSPLQLMTGKIIGIALTGLTMVFSWLVSFVALTTLLPMFMKAEMPVKLDIIAKDPLLLSSFIVYFLLGYLFFAALLVGIGSVCNSIKEANNLMMPVTVMLMLPLFALIPVTKDPNGALAVFLSYVPPFTPFIMMNRAGGPPTPTEYVVTSILLVVSIALVFWAAAKVFRIGILMTGKPPTPMEIIRWIKAPVGLVPTREDEEE
ncbi:MAG: ABC transporter permease [Planctomycetota bacterium]